MARLLQKYWWYSNYFKVSLCFYNDGSRLVYTEFFSDELKMPHLNDGIDVQFETFSNAYKLLLIYAIV